jgi:hypothetical protein
MGIEAALRLLVVLLRDRTTAGQDARTRCRCARNLLNDLPASIGVFTLCWLLCVVCVYVHDNGKSSIIFKIFLGGSGTATVGAAAAGPHNSRTGRTHPLQVQTEMLHTIFSACAACMVVLTCSWCVVWIKRVTFWAVYSGR